MAVAFEGFPRLLARTVLRPGRWFASQSGYTPMLGFMTSVGEGENALILGFRAGKLDRLEFATLRLRDLPGTFSSVEDELVFAPGEISSLPRLVVPLKRPFVSGSLMRLKNGDIGIGFAEQSGGPLVLISLATGEICEGFDMVFDRWSLSLRRGGEVGLIGTFRPSS